MMKPYIKSVKLFEVQDLYGHHLLGLVNLVYDPSSKIGSGPSRLDVRIVLDGNIEDDLSFKMDWDFLDPTKVDETPTFTPPAQVNEWEVIPFDFALKDVEGDESLMSPRALNAVL